MSVAAPVRQRQPVVVVAALLCAASMLGLGLWWPDGLVVALTGFAVASGLHTISHAIDRHLGGHDGDVPSLGLLTLVALVAISVRIRGRTT
jgi:cobalamin synthase